MIRAVIDAGRDDIALYTGNDDAIVTDFVTPFRIGTTQRRIWRLTRHADGRYTGTADDVVGTATGQTRGSTCCQRPLVMPLPTRSRFDLRTSVWR